MSVHEAFEASAVALTAWGVALSYTAQAARCCLRAAWQLNPASLSLRLAQASLGLAAPLLRPRRHLGHTANAHGRPCMPPCAAPGARLAA